MPRHRDLTSIKVNLCDPHSPWQRHSYGNTHDLFVNDALPEVIDLPAYSHEQIDSTNGLHDH